MPRPSWHSNKPVCLTPTGEGAPSKLEGVGGVCRSHSKGASLWQVVDSVHGLHEKGHPLWMSFFILAEPNTGRNPTAHLVERAPNFIEDEKLV